MKPSPPFCGDPVVLSNIFIIYEAKPFTRDQEEYFSSSGGVTKAQHPQDLSPHYPQSINDKSPW